MLAEFARTAARSAARETTLQAHLAAYMAALDLDAAPGRDFPLHKLYAGLQHTIKAVDAAADHAAYARGVGAVPGSFVPPAFEPYVPPPAEPLVRRETALLA